MKLKLIMIFLLCLGGNSFAYSSDYSEDIIILNKVDSFYKPVDKDDLMKAGGELIRTVTIEVTPGVMSFIEKTSEKIEKKIQKINPYIFGIEGSIDFNGCLQVEKKDTPKPLSFLLKEKKDDSSSEEEKFLDFSFDPIISSIIGIEGEIKIFSTPRIGGITSIKIDFGFDWSERREDFSIVITYVISLEKIYRLF